MDWAKIVCGRHGRSFLEWRDHPTGPQETKFLVACRACGGTVVHHATFAEAEQFAENVPDMDICPAGNIKFGDYFKDERQKATSSTAAIPPE
jgi:hypothetical protein